MFLRFTFLGLSTLEKIKITLEQIFLTVGQNNYGNKMPKYIKASLVTQIEHRFSFV